MVDKPAAKTSTPDTSLPDEPKGGGAASNNVASNGYWIHDDIGPRHYVAPPDGMAGDAPMQGDVVERIGAALRAAGDTDTSRVHVSIDSGGATETGIVGSAADQDRVAALAHDAARGVPVRMRVTIDTGLQGTGEDG